MQKYIVNLDAPISNKNSTSLVPPSFGPVKIFRVVKLILKNVVNEQ